MWSHNKGVVGGRMLVTVKEWLKSVLNYRSHPKNKTRYPFPFFWTTLYSARHFRRFSTYSYLLKLFINAVAEADRTRRTKSCNNGAVSTLIRKFSHGPCSLRPYPFLSPNFSLRLWWAQIASHSVGGGGVHIIHAPR